MDERIIRRGVGWEQWAALGCFVTAILSFAIGFVFTTGSVLNAEVHPVLHSVGIVLLIVGIPMMILGGHFMDRRDRRRHHGWR